MGNQEKIYQNEPGEVPEELQLNEEDWETVRREEEDEHSLAINKFFRHVFQLVEDGTFKDYINNREDYRKQEGWANTHPAWILKNTLERMERDLATSQENALKDLQAKGDRGTTMEQMNLGNKIKAMKALISQYNEINNGHYRKRKAMKQQMEEEGLGDVKKK